MEQQSLMGHSATQTQIHVHVASQAPIQVRLELKRGMFSTGSFDERTPYLLQGRVADDQFAATIHGLNYTFKAPSAYRALLWLSVIGVWAVAGIFVWRVTSWDYAMTITWVLQGMLILFAVMTIVFSIAYIYQLRRRVDDYLAQVNAHYNPQGINFCMEKGYRRWYLVIDIMPQIYGASHGNTIPHDDYQQTPIMIQPAYYHPNPAGFAPPQSQQALPQQQMPYSSNSTDQVAYQKPY